MQKNRQSVQLIKYLGFILLFLFLLYSPNLFNGFTWFDHSDIETKQAIKPFSEPKKIFLAQFAATSFYRPLLTLLNNVNYVLLDIQPFGFHLTNILLQLAVVVITPFFLTKFFSLSTREQVLAALIVGIHPVVTLIVGQISFRQESLMLALIMLTVIFYTKARTTNRPIFIAASAITTLLSLWTKETSLVILPLLILLWEYDVYRKPKNGVVIWSIECFTVLLYLLMRMIAVPHLWGIKGPVLSFDEAIGTRLGLFIKWIGHILVPLKPNFSDSVQIRSILDPVSVLALCIIIIALFFIKRFGLKSQLGILLLLFMILISPGLNIVPVPRVGSPHYAYVLSVPLAAAVSLLFWRLQNSFGKMIKMFMTLWLLTASIATFITGFQFKNDLTLFQSEVKRDPHFVEAYTYLGNYFLSIKDYDKAEQAFAEVLKPHPKLLFFHDTLSYTSYSMALAEVRMQQNRLDEADRLYAQLAKVAPTSISRFITYNQALVAYKRGDHQRVIALLAPQKKQWYQPEPFLLFANSLHASGRIDEEKEVLHSALLYMHAQQKKRIEAYMKILTD